MPEIDHEKYLVRKPIYEVGGSIKGRQAPTMTYMSSAQVPEANYYVEFGWIYGIPEPNPHILEHSHDYDEIVLHIGGDPENPDDLGGEIEYYVYTRPRQHRGRLVERRRQAWRRITTEKRRYQLRKISRQESHSLG